jgi:tRNA(fMet)-specific endonuclease VapC
VLQRLRTLHDPDTVAVTVISVEEQVRGRLEIIRRYGTSPLQIAAYAAFQQTLRFFTAWQVFDFGQAAFEKFEALRRQRVRVGSQDLRIAAICLALGATLVTRNNRDFDQIPSLLVENWSL